MRLRVRAEAVELRLGFGAGQLDDLEAVLAVGDVGEQGCVRGADDHVVGVGEFSAGVEHLVELRLFGPRDVDDGQAFGAVGDVGVGAGDVELPRVAQAQERALHFARVGGLRDVDHVQAVGGGDEGVAELHLYGARVGDGDGRDQARFERIGHVEHDDAGVGDNVERGAGNGEVLGAFEDAVVVPRRGADQIVVAEFAVGQGVDVGDDQAFFAIRDERVAVDGVHRLFLVRGDLAGFFVAREGDGLRGGEHHAGRVLAADVRVLARREQRVLCRIGITAC